MIDNEKSLIQSFYESHHEDGKRLKQSFLENRRGLLFAEWIGINKKVLDLGGRDGTLTKHFYLYTGKLLHILITSSLILLIWLILPRSRTISQIQLVKVSTS